MIKKISSSPLAKNTLILFIMLNFFNFLNFVYHFIIARMLTPADYGILVTLFSVIYIFGVPSEAIQNISSRLTSKFTVKEEDGKIKYFLKKSVQRGFIYSIGIFILLVLASFLMSEFLSINVLLIILTDSMIFFFILSPIPRGVLQGKKRFFSFGSTFVIESIFRLGLSVLFVFIGWKIYGAVAGVLIGVAVGFFVSLFFTRDILSKKEESVDFNGIYKFSVPFFISTLVILTIMSMDMVLARRFFSAELVGQYAVISTLGKIVFFGTSSIGRSMFPFTSERFEENQNTSKIFQKSFIIIIGLSLVVLAMFYLIPNTIIGLTFGNQYLGAANLLIFSGIALTILSLSNLVLLYGLSVNRLRKPWILFIFLIIEIILLTVFSNNLKSYILAFIVSNTIMFIGSFLLIKK